MARRRRDLHQRKTPTEGPRRYTVTPTCEEPSLCTAACDKSFLAGATRGSPKAPAAGADAAANVPVIVRPALGSLGEGIAIYPNRSAASDRPGVATRYLTNPLTVDGRKVDLRLYLFVDFPNAYVRRVFL